MDPRQSYNKQLEITACAPENLSFILIPNLHYAETIPNNSGIQTSKL